MTMVVLSQSAPVMVVSPLNLSINTMEGQSDPPVQVVMITNSGVGQLYWNMDWMMDGAIANRSWLSASATHGVVSPGLTTQVTIRMNTKGVTSGIHIGNVDFWEVGQQSGHLCCFFCGVNIVRRRRSMSSSTSNVLERFARTTEEIFSLQELQRVLDSG
jgi:hypothetical protein